MDVLNTKNHILQTVSAKLVAREVDPLGYVTYVFETPDLESKYLMCVQFKNWDHRLLQIGEVGYVTYREIIAGMDKWFDGNDFIPYRYDNIQFIKFIPKIETSLIDKIFKDYDDENI